VGKLPILLKGALQMPVSKNRRKVEYRMKPSSKSLDCQSKKVRNETPAFFIAIRHAAETNEHFLCGKRNEGKLNHMIAFPLTPVTCNDCQKSLVKMKKPELVHSYEPL
jgi:hypothetical protein